MQFKVVALSLLASLAAAEDLKELIDSMPRCAVPCLDDAAKAEILRIMKKRRLPFDDARRAYMEQRFSANGIGPDGRPRDPKFVSFS